MFGQILREERKVRKKTLRELSKELDISFSSLGKYERGENEPDISTLIKIADYFDVSVDYMLGKTNIKNINGAMMLSHDHYLFEKIKSFTPEEQGLVLQITNAVNLLFEPCMFMNEKFDKSLYKIFAELFRQLYTLNTTIHEYYHHSSGKKSSISYNRKRELKENIKLHFFDSKVNIDESIKKLLDFYLSKAADNSSSKQKK